MPTEVARVVDRVLLENSYKHVGIAVGVRRGEETFLAGRGRVGGDRRYPPDERTIFEIGSITKAFTGTLLANMARTGLVGLDDPVQKYLPDGVVIPVRGRPITLADLASHTSGLPRLPKHFRCRAIRESRNPYASFTVADLHTAIVATKPRRPPGRKIRYSNYGAGLLGYVLARRAGMTYEELVAEQITGPLGMADTSIVVPDEKLDRFAQGHSRRGRKVSNWDFAALAGAGGLRSTVADLLVFLEAQLGKAPAGLAEAMATTQQPRARAWRLAVGLGWMIEPAPGQPGSVVWHDGGTGGFRSFAGFVAETCTSIVVLSSSARGVEGIGFDILRRLGR